MKREITQEEINQLEAYLRKCCAKGLGDESDKEELQQEMWCYLLECGVMDNEIIENGKLNRGS